LSLGTPSNALAPNTGGVTASLIIDDNEEQLEKAPFPIVAIDDGIVIEGTIEHP
jgi:hypothetical protein